MKHITKKLKYVIEIEVPYDATNLSTKEQQKIENKIKRGVRNIINYNMSYVYWCNKVENQTVEFRTHRIKNKLICK